MQKIGSISSFGGPTDKGMTIGEGTSFYEYHEADKRPDLFSPQTYPKQGVGHRLRNKEVFYIALNVPTSVDRHDAHKSLWRVTNLKNGFSAQAYLVDRGPSAAGRLVDASDHLLAHIEAHTDDMVRVEQITRFAIPFGVYGEYWPVLS